jgi:hypothetical protein
MRRGLKWVRANGGFPRKVPKQSKRSRRYTRHQYTDGKKRETWLRRNGSGRAVAGLEATTDFTRALKLRRNKGFHQQEGQSAAAI